jgi:uncharacterized RDD family membrane protein YckC
VVVPTNIAPPVAPSIRRRLACLPYEGLLLLALLLIAAFPVAGLKGLTLQGLPHLLFQAYLAIVVGSYFVWFWTHGGQTLPMKTWRFRVQRADGGRLRLPGALWRLLLAALFFGPACVGIVLIFFPARVSPALTVWTFVPLLATLLWAAFDADRQFLHDRLAGTRLVSS